MVAEKGSWDFFDLENGRLVLFVVTSIRAPDVQAFAIMGIEIDQEFVNQFSSLAQVDLTVHTETEGKKPLIISTFKKIDQMFEMKPLEVRNGMSFIQYECDGESHFGKQIELFKEKEI